MDRERSGSNSTERRENPSDRDEFYAILGLMLFRGLNHDSKNPTEELWGDKGAQRPLYRAVIDRSRFFFVMCCSTFHDRTTLRIDYTDDRFAKMREVLNMFEQNLWR